MTLGAKKGESTVLWWIGWILLTILSFFVSCWFWTGFIARHVGNMSKPGAPLLWVSAVFGSWMVLLVPLIIVMYSKVDKAYEDARLAKETAASSKSKPDFGIKTVYLEESKLQLKKNLADKLKKTPATIRRGHLVTAVLKDGRRIENVFVYDRKNVLGVYGLNSLTFQIEDITDVVPTDLDHLPDFRTEKWLRLDWE